MRGLLVVLGLWLAAPVLAAEEGPSIAICSPGFTASQMDAAGRLIEDWGAVKIQVRGEGVAAGPTQTEAIRLDEVIPAARATAECGAVRLIVTAYRAPAFPSGVDVLTARVEETRSQPAQVVLGLALPEGARRGLRTVKLGGRTVLDAAVGAGGGTAVARVGLLRRGHAASRLGTARRPVRPGVPQHPRRPGRSADRISVSGAAEEPGQRRAGLVRKPLGGARPAADQLPRRGRRAANRGSDRQMGPAQSGRDSLPARDANGDGMLEISVRPAAGAPDRNPILNAIWVFRPGDPPPLDEVVAGERSASALHYVDVGGENDQSLFPPGNWESRLELPAGGSRN